MRDIVRFINILEFNLELVNGEVNFVDFIVITTIQVFYSEVYDKIKLNEFLLINYHYTIVDEFTNDILAIEKSEFEEIVQGNENLNYILRILFPKMENSYIYRPSFKFENEKFADKNLLISHPNHFKAYFKLNCIIKDLSESEIDFIVHYINSKDNASVVMEFNRLYKENKLRQFFESIKNRLDKILKNKFFLNFLFTIDTKMGEDIFFSNRGEIEDLCLELIYQMDGKDRLIVLNEIYQKSKNVILLFDLLKDIRSKNYLPYNYDEFILTEDGINDLTQITKEKFNKIPNNSFLIENKLSELLYIGVKLNLGSKNESIIDELISTSQGVLTLLKSFLPHLPNSNFLLRDMEQLNEYKNVDEIKQLIDNDKSIKDELIVKIFLEGYEKFNNQ